MKRLDLLPLFALAALFAGDESRNLSFTYFETILLDLAGETCQFSSRFTRTEAEMFIGRREYLADLETLWRKRPVLVYAGELAKSVEADGFFDTIVPARRLLGMEN